MSIALDWDVKQQIKNPLIILMYFTQDSRVAIFLSLYLEKHDTPIPVWTPKVGFRIIWYPLHQVFSVGSLIKTSN